jgi:serine/threonine protein kinase
MEQLAEEGALSVVAALSVLADVAAVVERVHRRGFAHRNLQPSNILVADGGPAKLVGFGLVGFLAGSELVPAGRTGVPAEVDIRALQGTLGWLCGALRQAAPSRLEAIRRADSWRSIDEFKDALSGCIQEL